ncbi:MAG: calcium-binding protein [Sphingomonas sp.]|nr:calcium-binding protein [Sphingomonas sp.]
MRLLLIAVFAALAAPLAAQQSPEPNPVPAAPPRDQPPSPTIFAEPVALFIATCDGNADAMVTPAELMPCVARSYAPVGGTAPNSIGYIQFADWAERWLGDRNALPSPFETDSDGNNRITLAEIQAQLAKTFARFDRDKDGLVKRSELLTLDSGRGLGGRAGPPAPDERRRRR